MVLETQFYEILSVPVNASTEDIAKAYRRQALKCHPDKTNHDPLLTEKFKEMTQAYEVLKDSKSRSVYDSYGVAGLEGSYDDKSTGCPLAQFQQQQAFQQQNFQQQTFQQQAFQQQNFHQSFQKSFQSGPSRRPCAFTAATDMFSQVFTDINSMFEAGFPKLKGFHGQVHQQTASFANPGPSVDMKKHVKPASPDDYIRGQDIHHTCNVSLGDLYFGKTIKLQLPKNTKCGSCEGQGGFNVKTCKQCEGSGRVVTTFYNQFSQHQSVGSCKPCEGTGIFITPMNLCSCERGYRRDKKLLSVNVLPGSSNGDKIILQGEADEGRRIIPGDVIIHLTEIPHDYLVRKFHDLYMEHEIDLRTALLGGTIILNDFLKPANSIRIFLNVHGLPEVNSVVNESLQLGEVLGTIKPNQPKIVKGLGMPINEIVQGGEYVESFDSVRDVVFDLKRYRRGHLFINFHIRLPSIDELSAENLLQLHNILPREDILEREVTQEAYLSNLPCQEAPRRRASPGKVKSSQDNVGNLSAATSSQTHNTSGVAAEQKQNTSSNKEQNTLSTSCNAENVQNVKSPDKVPNNLIDLNKNFSSSSKSSPGRLDSSSDFNYEDIDFNDKVEGDHEEEDYYNKTWAGTPQPNFDAEHTPFDSSFSNPFEGAFSGIPKPKKRKHNDVAAI